MIVAGISIPEAELIEDLIEQYGIGFGTSVSGADHYDGGRA